MKDQLHGFSRAVRVFSLLGHACVALGFTLGCKPVERGRISGETFNAGSFIYDDARSISHRFVLRNTTNQTVRIERLIPACSCSESTIDKRLLAPNETAVLDMRVNLPNTYISAATVCDVETDLPEPNKLIQFKITYLCAPRVKFSQPSVDLGALDPSTPESKLVDQIVQVESFASLDRPDHFIIEAVASKGLNCRILPESTYEKTHPGLTRRVFKLAVSRSHHDNSSLSSGSGTLTVRTNLNASATIPVRWSLPKSVSIAPSAIHFGTLGAAETAQRRVVIHASPAHPLPLLEVASTGLPETMGGMDVGLTKFKEGIWILTASLRLSVSVAGISAFKGSIQLRSADGNSEVIAIPWSVFVSGSRS